VGLLPVYLFTCDDAQDDCAFVLTRYFPGQACELGRVTKHEWYAQRARIADLFGYRLWSADFLPSLTERAAQIARRDVAPGLLSPN